MLALQKTVDAFLTFPGLYLLLSMIMGTYLVIKGGSLLMKLLSILTVLLMVITFTGLGVKLFLLPLEDYAVYDLESYQNPHPIVVLGGGINHGVEAGRAELSAASLRRLTYGYQLYRKLESTIIFTGGVGVGYEDASEAGTAGEWLINMGVAADDIYLETRARTTFENAVYVKEWLQKSEIQKIYLVTSAVHLPRSAAVFNEQGIDFIPVPAGHLYDRDFVWLDYLPNRSALTANMSALHEWLGLLWYKITGRI